MSLELIWPYHQPPKLVLYGLLPHDLFMLYPSPNEPPTLPPEPPFLHPMFKMLMRHNLFYVDNTAQVRGGLRGTLGKE